MTARLLAFGREFPGEYKTRTTSGENTCNIKVPGFILNTSPSFTLWKDATGIAAPLAGHIGKTHPVKMKARRRHNLRIANVLSINSRSAMTIGGDYCRSK
jgi:hypothetical protein